MIGLPSVVPVDGGFIYVARRGDVGSPVKIGYSKSPSARLVGLNAGAPSSIEIVASMLASPASERAAHTCLENHRIRREWFAWHDDVKRFVEFCQSHACDSTVRPFDVAKAIHGWAYETAPIFQDLKGRIRFCRMRIGVGMLGLNEQTGIQVNTIERGSQVTLRDATARRLAWRLCVDQEWLASGTGHDRFDAVKAEYLSSLDRYEIRRACVDACGFRDCGSPDSDSDLYGLSESEKSRWVVRYMRV